MLATAGLTRSTMSAKEAGARPRTGCEASCFSCAYTLDCESPSPTTPASARPTSADAQARRRVLARDVLWQGGERSMRLTSRVSRGTGCAYTLSYRGRPYGALSVALKVGNNFL